jgi:hypothetical protein
MTTDHQPKPRRLGWLGATVLGVVGGILLLPVLCSVLFVVYLSFSGSLGFFVLFADARWKLALSALWTAGSLLGAIGVWLITMAVRALRQDRRLGWLGATVLGVVGGILFVFSVLFAVYALTTALFFVGSHAPLLVLWALAMGTAGILWGVIGVWLITIAVRVPNQPRT